jgi:L,D-transpeptidase catalytic domain
VIRPEQLAEALDRIPPRDRELLSLSLRRRVPDEALGRLYECSPSEVARLRARAIERLADEMELQRGEDLGAVLKALLEPSTWSQAASTVGEEFAAGGGRSRLAAVPVPEEEPEVTIPPPLAPVPPPADLAPAEAGEAEAEPTEAEPEEAEPEEAEPEEAERAATEAEPAAPAERGPAEATEAEPAPAEPAQAAASAGAAAPSEAAREPVPDPIAEMLAERRREAPDPPRRAVPMALVGLGIAALVGVAGVVGATQFGGDERVVPQGTGGGGGDGTRDFVPEKGGPLAAPFPTEPNETSCYSTASIRKSAVLYREPGGAKRLRITPKTEWGSARVLGVVSQRGDWLGVQAAELKNGEIAWIQRDRTTLDCVGWSLHADLSKRSLQIRHNGRTVRKLRVAIGRKDNPTPTGRFTVTDRLQVTTPGSPYGCCVLALTGHQTNLPPYWPGGDRLAVHATNDESSIGQPVSLGCMRAESAEARWLINHVPLGSPIFIHS